MKIKFGTAALALTFLLSACSSSSDKASSSEPIVTCQNASEEDLKNINDGMISAKYRVESGFTAYFNGEDIKTIEQVFPGLSSLKVLAAHIPSSDGRVVIGLWGIQRFDFGGRITALNDETQKYSTLGAGFSGNSATGRVNAVMLELSANTNVISCIQKSRPPLDFPS